MSCLHPNESVAFAGYDEILPLFPANRGSYFRLDALLSPLLQFESVEDAGTG
jgi:hypothetical protein